MGLASGSVMVGLPPHSCSNDRANVMVLIVRSTMTTEVRNWAIVAKAMEDQGAIHSQMYKRARALADGMSDPMPTSFPQAPFSISGVAG